MKSQKAKNAWSILASAEENRAALQDYRTRYAGLIAAPNIEAPGITYTLAAGAAGGDSKSKAALLEIGAAAFRELLALAEQDPDVTARLFSMISDHVHKLNAISMRNGPAAAVLKLCARNTTAWPILAYRHSEHRQRAERHAYEVMQTGADYPRNFTGGFSYQTAVNAIAESLCAEIEAYRQAPGVFGNGEFAKLKPLSRPSAPDWWRIAKPIFTARYSERAGGDFTLHPMFAGHWRNAKIAAERAAAERKKAALPPIPPTPKSAVRDKIRRAILKDLKRAFLTIAR